MVVLLVMGPACSDRDVESVDSGPIWPDGFIDAAVESGPPPDSAGNGDCCDAAGSDAPLSDAPLADAPVPDAAPPPGWKPVKVGFTLTADLHGIACVKGNVYAVGDKGTLIHNNTSKTTGFGKLTISTTSDLYTVSFADLTYGVVAGKDYQIWQTQDTGAIWSVAAQCSAYIFDTFYALHLYTANKGFGAGLAASNGGGGAKYYEGYSWVCSSPSYPTLVFYDVFRLADSGWIVGDTKGKIYYSVDMGVNWKTVSAGTTQVLRGVTFPAATLGVAVGHKGAIVRSTDGKGLTWGAVTSPTSEDLYDVTFWDVKQGWAVGDKGAVLQTVDGGKTWTKQVSGSTSRLEAVCFTSATEGWAVGAAGTILHTTTGGK